MLTNPHIGEGRLDPNEPVEIVDTVHLRSVWDLGIAGSDITSISLYFEGEAHTWYVGPFGDLIFRGADAIPIQTHQAVAEMAKRTERTTDALDWYDRLLSGDPE